MMGSFPKSKFEFISDDLALDFVNTVDNRDDPERRIARHRSVELGSRVVWLWLPGAQDGFTG